MVVGDGGAASAFAGCRRHRRQAVADARPKILIFKKRRRSAFPPQERPPAGFMEVRITRSSPRAGTRRSAPPPPPPPSGRVPEPAAAAKPAAAAPASAVADQADADDLSLISGVGPKIKQSLNELGYLYFAQIAALLPGGDRDHRDGLEVEGAHCPRRVGSSGARA
jgi:hypothetical protein